MFSPPLMIMSSTRPATHRSPSASSQPMSPVKYQPSRSARASASGRFQYPENASSDVRLAMISPQSPAGTASSGPTRRSVLATTSRRAE